MLQPSTLRSPARAPWRARAAARSRSSTRARTEPTSAQTDKDTAHHKHHHKDLLPHLEQWDDDDTLLPRRHPGQFPVLDAHPPGAAMSSSDSDAEEPFDPLRDGPLRYCGYANEVGEAFGAWLPVYGVPASYAVAIAYVLVDTYDKAAAAHRKASVLRQGAPAEAAARGGVNLDSLIALLAVERAVDTLLWQLLASVAIPGFTIHQVVHFSHAALVQGAHLDDLQAAPAALAGAVAAIAATFSAPPDAVADVLERMLPTMVGLAVIPFIVHPIDNAVHVLLNTTLRRSMRTVICQRGGEAVGLDMCHIEWEGEPSSSIALQTVDGGVSPLAAAAPGSAGTGASGRQSAALGGSQGHLKGAASARDTKTHAISRRASRVLSAMQPAAAINGTHVPAAERYAMPNKSRAAVLPRLQAEQLQQQQRETNVMFALMRAAILTAPVAALLLTALRQ